MSRPLRLEYPGALYHVLSRGNAKQSIFQDDLDRNCFLLLLGREIRQQGWRCYAYCLMSNHFHLLIETPRAGLSRGMQRLIGGYAVGHNRRHHRIGHLFHGRYGSILVEKESYLLELSRYIVLNPVRARLVSRVEEWVWSSYRATAGLAEVPGWLDASWLLEQFGKTPHMAHEGYRKFVRDGYSAGSPFRDLRGQVWLGGETFRSKMQESLGDLPSTEFSTSQRAPSRPTKIEVLKAVGAVFRLPQRQLRNRESQEAYQVAAYLLRRRANLSLKEVAEIFGVSPSRISHIQEAVERNGANGRLNRLLNRCEVKI